MERIPFLLIAVFAVPFTAFGDSDDDHSGDGRYQIMFSAEGLYFLDTTSGELWLKTSYGEWDRADSPVNRKPRSTNRKPTSTEHPPKPVLLTLPRAGETMPMVQREKRAIPGSSETLWVQVGDITGGQVFVEISDLNGHQLVERTSLKANEVVKFKVNDKDVYLQVVDMVNNLLGEDVCQVRFSFLKPKPERKVKRRRTQRTRDPNRVSATSTD